MTETSETAGERAPGDDWPASDSCHTHWRIRVDNGPVIMLTTDGDRQAYLDESEAEAIGHALIDYAAELRAERSRPGGSPIRNLPGRHLVLVHHDFTPYEFNPQAAGGS